MQADKDLYRQLRQLPPEKLWDEEAPKFDRAPPEERPRQVALIRALGVAFAGSSDTVRRTAVRAWMVNLLQDPAEKVRRYAMAALPKLGGGPAAERQLLTLLERTGHEREKKFLGRALGKIGGQATLEVVSRSPGLLPQAEQKVRAQVARHAQPSAVLLDHPCAPDVAPRVHLRCRRGLEEILRSEADEVLFGPRLFRFLEIRPGCVAAAPLRPFPLGLLYELRCLGVPTFPLGLARGLGPAELADEVARIITSPATRALLRAFTRGALRYRVEFLGRGHQRGAVRQIADRAFARCPELLNDARLAPWSMDLFPASQGVYVEVRPRLSPDPRWFYREDDVAAASHPPLAAAMARLAGRMDDEVVWDPFCGSGLELIERALRGGVRVIHGTDLSAEALEIARANVRAARLHGVESRWTCGDFRGHAGTGDLLPGSVSLVLTNPPMGRRIRIQNLRGLIADLLAAAATVLKPGGRLVFPNPVRVQPHGRALRREYQRVIDLGGFDCRLELYRKV